MSKKLLRKGWSREEVDRAERIRVKAEENKHPHVRKLEEWLYWLVLVIGIVGTVLFSLVGIPLLFTAGVWAYIIIGLLGFLLGTLIVIIINELDWLEHHHHVLLSFLIPIIALLNFFLITSRVNLLSYSLGFNNYHSPLLSGIIFSFCFLVPYAYLFAVKQVK